jgi:Nif-specific regulatory protein
MPSATPAALAHATTGVGVPTDWAAQELLLMREVMRLMGHSLSAAHVLKEMLHLMSELLGLNRGRVVMADALPQAAPTAAIRHAYGLTAQEVARGVYAWGEGITGQVLATGQPALVQDIDAEPRFLFRSVHRDQLPPETVAFLALPITVNSVTVGVLACHRLRSRQRHLNDDLAMLRTLATLAGQLLRLEALVQEQTAQLQHHNAALAHALDSHAARYGLVGHSPALLQALGELERVSQSNATVLLLGESGTGKELFARALHLASKRCDRPFIKVNCSAIPDTLFESELFGHERGAFTGAVGARAGWFEQANGGSIFLDEMGELPLAMQAKLLRTLQEGTLVRLGGTREVKVDVRLVAATHRDLAREVAAGRFRQDLFYRLNVVPIRLPSLRERMDDIHPLALHFLSRANQAHQRNVHLTPEALGRLAEHDWPGNVRELGNLIERVVLLSDHPTVHAHELGRYLPGASEPMPWSGTSAPTPTQAAAPTEPPLVREHLSAQSHGLAELQAALQRHGGNQSRAAQSLGLTLRQYNYRLKKAGLR